ncbi:MAG: hypothetical protein ABI588_05520 [Arenimonas sp.]
MRREKGKQEPYWEPLARQKFSATQNASIVARHLVPLLGLWWYHGSVGQFLLLGIFNIAFTIASIGTVGVGVSMKGKFISAADELAGWSTLAGITLVISVGLTAMFGWVIALMASGEPGGFLTATFAWSLLAVVLCALPGMYTQYREDLRSGLSEEARKKRDQPQVLVHVISAGLLFLLSGHVASFGRVGAIILALAMTALFVFRDLRPDLARELARPSNRPP